MNEQRNNDSGKLICLLLLAGLILYAAIFLLLVLGVILTTCLTAGAAYLGYKAAFDTQLGEQRRIARDRKLERARTTQIAHYRAKGQEWMMQVVDNYYDDQQRELYQKETSGLDATLNGIRKIKDALK